MLYIRSHNLLITKACILLLLFPHFFHPLVRGDNYFILFLSIIYESVFKNSKISHSSLSQCNVLSARIPHSISVECFALNIKIPTWFQVFGIVHTTYISIKLF